MNRGRKEDGVDLHGKAKIGNKIQNGRVVMKKLLMALLAVVIAAAFVSSSQSVWAQEEIALDGAAVLDTAPFDPSALHGKWIVNASGGKTLTPNGKKGSYAEKTYLLITGPAMDPFPNGDTMVYVLNGSLFADREQTTEIRKIWAWVGVISGQISIDVTDSFDNQPADCTYGIAGFYFAPSGKKKAHIEARILKTCGDSLLVYSQCSSAMGTLTQY